MAAQASSAEASAGAEKHLPKWAAWGVKRTGKQPLECGALHMSLFGVLIVFVFPLFGLVSMKFNRKDIHCVREVGFRLRAG